MHLEPGALKDIVDSAIAQGSYVVCHETLPGMAPPGFAPAICRGFQDRYSTAGLEVIARLWVFVNVDPPSAPAATHGAEASAPTAVPSDEIDELLYFSMSTVSSTSSTTLARPDTSGTISTVRDPTAGAGPRPRPASFLLGLSFAVLGLGLSTVFVQETHHHARHEARNH
jgi:hypothetical protein